MWLVNIFIDPGALINDKLFGLFHGRLDIWLVDIFIDPGTFITNKLLGLFYYRLDIWLGNNLLLEEMTWSSPTNLSA